MRTFILLLFCVLAAAFMTTGCSSDNSPEGVAKAFYKRLFVKGDFDSAMELMVVKVKPTNNVIVDAIREEASRPFIQDVLLPVVFLELNAKFEKNGGLKKISVEKVESVQNDKHARIVHMIFKCKNGYKIKNTTGVIKTDKGWRIGKN